MSGLPNDLTTQTSHLISTYPPKYHFRQEFLLNADPGRETDKATEGEANITVTVRLPQYDRNLCMLSVYAQTKIRTRPVGIRRIILSGNSFDADRNKPHHTPSSVICLCFVRCCWCCMRSCRPLFEHPSPSFNPARVTDYSVSGSVVWSQNPRPQSPASSWRRWIILQVLNSAL